MQVPQCLWIHICRDDQRRVWGVVRAKMTDGSNLVIEGRVFRETGVQGRDYAAGGEEPPKNRALDDALDKLCKLAKTPVVKAALPLPVRVALMAVCKARNLMKIKKAIDLEPEEYDDDDAEAVGAQWSNLRRSRNPIHQRAIGALRLWS